MEPIYKIGNRKVKRPNPQNQCSMQSQYEQEQQRLNNKRLKIQQREENMRKLHTGTYKEKREVYDEILKVQKDFQNAREDRIKNQKQQERLLEFKGIAYCSEQEKIRKEKELEQRQENQKANQKNRNFKDLSSINYIGQTTLDQQLQNKPQRERYYKKRNQLIFEQIMQSPPLPYSEELPKQESLPEKPLHKSNLKKVLSDRRGSKTPDMLQQNYFVIKNGKKKQVVMKRIVKNDHFKRQTSEQQHKRKINFTENQVILVQSFKEYNKPTVCCYCYTFQINQSQNQFFIMGV